MAQDLASDPGPRGQRRPRGPALSEARITAEALALIDAEGLDAFSFRTLAARLGCQAMSIYHYFPSKAHLYEALVELCLADASDFSATGPWQDQLRAAAAAYRQMALNHPGFYLFLGIFRMNSAAGLAYLDRILRIFAATGLPADLQARHFRILGYYLMGALVDETIGYSRGPTSVAPIPPDLARRDYPAIAAAGAFFGPDRHQATFDAGLEVILAGIEAEISRLPPSRSDS